MISPVSQFNTLLSASRPGSSRTRSIDPLRLADSVRGGAEQNVRPERGNPHPEDAVKLNLSQEKENTSLSSSTYNRGGILRDSPSQSSNNLSDTLDHNQQEREDKEATEESKREIVDDLKERDREVKTHEQAHKSALGPYSAGGINLEYTTGPDGGRYAVSGHVPVDLSKENEPEETVKKAQTIRKAALAPKEPSSADQQVAARASQLEAEARVELREEKQTEKTEDTSQAASLDSQANPLDSSLPSPKELREKEDEDDSLFESRPRNLRPEDKGSFLDIAA